MFQVQFTFPDRVVVILCDPDFLEQFPALTKAIGIGSFKVGGLSDEETQL